MGQYYTPIIKRGNSVKGFYSWDYNSGLKLTEHSYKGNHFTETVVSELLDNPGRLAWVGDYAEREDVNSPLAVNFIEAEKKFGQGSLKYSNPETKISEYLYIVNHDKKEFIDMASYLSFFTFDEVILHPLPLLTAIGNGKGGGDYCGTCMNKIGAWACDKIEVTNIIYGYTDITQEVIFKETI